MLDYPLAPEHAFPAALDATLQVYRWLLDSGVSPARVVLAGDSAGAGLALATMLALRAAGQPMPAAGVWLSPWVDLAFAGESHTALADRDPILLSEARQLAKAAEHAGVSTTYEEWPNMIHVWHYYFTLLAEGASAVTAIGAFVRRSVGTPVTAG